MLQYDEQTQQYGAHLTLNKTDKTFPTNGWYNGFLSTDENGVSVIYFNWYAGAGNETELELIPKQFVIYRGWGQIKSPLSVGIFTWQEDDKFLKHFIYQCD